MPNPRIRYDNILKVNSYFSKRGDGRSESGTINFVIMLYMPLTELYSENKTTDLKIGFLMDKMVVLC